MSGTLVGRSGAIRDSRLFLLGTPNEFGAGHQRVLDAFKATGIDPRRISFSRRLPFADYLAAHGQFDVFLDTTPVAAHPTSCHALWMGVPVITLAGQTFAARTGADVLTALNMKEWIATSVSEFSQIAVTQTQDLNRLAALRGSLRETVRRSTLTDGRRLARNVENAYQGMLDEKRLSTSGN